MLLPGIAITQEAALRDLRSPKASVRERAARALGTAEDNASEVSAALLSVLDDADATVVLASMRSLTELVMRSGCGHVQDRTPVEQKLQSNDEELRIAALDFAAACPSQSSFEQAKELLDHKSGRTRFHAVHAIAAMDSAGSLDILVGALGDQDQEVIAAAALALTDAPASEVLKPLRAALATVSAPATRFDIAYTLAQYGDSAGIGVLTEFSNDPDLAWDALEALERLAIAKAAAKLVAYLPKALKPKPHQVRIAGAVLALSSDAAARERAQECIRQGLAHRRLGVVAVSIEMLCKHGGTWAIPDLRRLQHNRRGKFFSEEITDAIAQIQERDHANR